MNNIINILLNLDETDRNILIDNMDMCIINEIGVDLLNNPIAKHAAISGGLSAAGNIGTFIVDYKNLKKKWKECEDLPSDEEESCKKRIEKELKKHRAEAIKQGITGTAMSAAIGGGIGYYLHKKKNNKDTANQETK